MAPTNPSQSPLDSLWAQALEDLKLQTTRGTFDQWLRDTRAVGKGEADSALIIATPNRFALDWLENRLRRQIQQVLTLRGHEGPVRFIVLLAGDGEQELKEVAEREGARRPQCLDPNDTTSRVIVELMEFDPLQRGFVQIPSYAIRFWQPYLGLGPFNVWLTLKSYALPGNDDWPTLAALARICAKGQKQTLTGRGDRKQQGWLEVLRDERIIWYEREGQDYLFRVLNTLPLLTPSQLAKLPRESHQAHDDFVTKAKLDLQAWRQLTLHDLIKEDP